MTGFDEHSLRADIAKTWGEHGAHMAVFDHMLKLIHGTADDEILVRRKATADEAIAEIHKIRHNCDDVTIKCFTVQDILDSALEIAVCDYKSVPDDWELTDEQDWAAREAIRNSWEFRKFPEPFDSDWEWFDPADIENLGKIIKAAIEAAGGKAY